MKDGDDDYFSMLPCFYRIPEMQVEECALCTSFINNNELAISIEKYLSCSCFRNSSFFITFVLLYKLIMIVELLIVLVALIFACKASPKSILCVLFLLLPLHGTVKNIVFTNGGTIFAMWKELVMIVLLYRNRSETNYIVSKFVSYFIFYGIFLFLFLLIGFIEGHQLASPFKRMFFPPLFFLCMLKIKLTDLELVSIFKCILIGSVLINITGVVDFFSPTFSMLFKDIMHVGYKISGDKIIYDTSSYSIMGLNRVCGLMEGGPNQLGVFNSSIIIISSISFLYYKRMLSKNVKIIVLSSTVLCVFCLITSFSRAGWAIVVITLFLLALTNKQYKGKAIGAITIVVILFIFTYLLVPQVHEVVSATLSGKEASSASRYSMTLESLDFLLSNPWGNGIGSSGHNGIHFAESSLINIGIDIGILGLLLLLRFQYLIYKQSKGSKSLLAPITSSFILAYVCCSFVSVNPYENPFVYYAWFIMGLPFIKKCVKPRNK